MVAINFDSEGRIQMLQDDFILRQIREMVHAVMKMLFQISASELTPEVIEDSTAERLLRI